MVAYGRPPLAPACGIAAYFVKGSDMAGLLRNAQYQFKRLLPFYWPKHPKYNRRYPKPRVVYLLAMPRTGSTLAKRYLGEYRGLVVAPNRTYRHAWRLSKKLGPDSIVIDKRTNNLDKEKLARIYFEYGNQVWFAGVVRDPRDQFVSLLETDRHMRVPRTEAFWPLWKAQYDLLFEFAGRRAAKGTNVCLMRYEDLVRNPAAVKSDFLRWLGIQIQPDEITSIYSNVIPEIASGEDMGEDWKTHQHSEVHKNSLGRWQKVSDPAVIELLNLYRKWPDIALRMEQLGYGDSVQPVKWRIEGIHLLGASTVNSDPFV